MMTDHIQLCQKSLRSFQILRDQNDFYDVTLMTYDHKTQAHKAVLSAFSPFFKNIFESCNVREHLFLYLDVRTENLLGILDYIYKGEVSVPVNRIEQFIKSASKLKISELIKVNIEDQETLVGKPHAPKKSLFTSITGRDGFEYQFSGDNVEEHPIKCSNSQQYYNSESPKKNHDNVKMITDRPYNIDVKKIEDFYEVIGNNKEHEKEYSDTIQQTKENIQQHERDSIDDCEDRIEVIENKAEENSSQIQEHNLKGILKHQEFEARIKDQYSVYSRVNPKDENDYLVTMRVVMLKMNTEKVPLKNISFSKIIKVVVKEGQMQLTNLKSFKDSESEMNHLRDMACKMKARIEQMVKEWNLTKTVDNRHCSPENKEMFELYIADIATLENNFNEGEHGDTNSHNEENIEQIERDYIDNNWDDGIEDFIEVIDNKVEDKSNIQQEHNLTDEKVYSLVNSRIKMKKKVATDMSQSPLDQCHEPAGRILSGHYKTDYLKEVISRVANVTKSLNMSWEKLSSRHFKNEIILPLLSSNVLPKKTKGIRGIKDYSSFWNQRVRAIYEGFLEETDEWDAEFTRAEADSVKNDLRVIRDISEKHRKEKTEYWLMSL